MSSNDYKPTKMVKVGDLFTEAEIKRAAALFDKHQQSGLKLVDALQTEVVEPALPRIDTATGQRNDARYLAYVLEYAMRNFGRPV